MGTGALAEEVKQDVALLRAELRLTARMSFGGEARFPLVNHGKVATQSRRSLPRSERSDAGRSSIILQSLLLSTVPAVSAWSRPVT